MRVSEALVRETLAQQYQIPPEDVSWKQIQLAVSELFPHYQAIEVMPTEPVRPAQDVSNKIPTGRGGVPRLSVLEQCENWKLFLKEAEWVSRTSQAKLERLIEHFANLGKLDASKDPFLME